jgi:hypothetical protein
VLPGTVKEGTLTNYTDVISAYVISHVGNVPLAKLGPEHVQGMMRALERAGRSPGTISLARTVLRRNHVPRLWKSTLARHPAASMVNQPERPLHHRRRTPEEPHQMRLRDPLG